MRTSRIYWMSDADAISRLLAGEIEASEIESDGKLYSMALRIYGQEALEDMGVSPPEISTSAPAEAPAPLPNDVTLPEFTPEISDSKDELKAVNKGKFRVLTLLFGISGMIGVILNMAIGFGSVLCSAGLADMKQICGEGKTKLVWENGYTWDGLHQIESWVDPMSFNITDIMILTVFFLITLVGLFVRK